MDYPYKYIEKEHSKFLNRLNRVRIGYSLPVVDRLSEMISMGESWKERYNEALNAPVSYTHLDVYKRQALFSTTGRM